MGLWGGQGLIRSVLEKEMNLERWQKSNAGKTTIRDGKSLRAIKGFWFWVSKLYIELDYGVCGNIP